MVLAAPGLLLTPPPDSSPEDPYPNPVRFTIGLMLETGRFRPKSVFYGRLRGVTDAQRPLLPRPLLEKKKKENVTVKPGAKT